MILSNYILSGGAAVKYQVNLTERSYGFIEIDASDEQDALNKATEEYHNSNFIFPKIDIELEIGAAA